MQDRVVIRCTSAETGGRAVVVEALLAVGGFAGSLGDGVTQERRFEVVHGQVAFELEEGLVVLTAGERLTVEPGGTYRLWNAGVDDAQFVCEVRPALDFEQRVGELFGAGLNSSGATPDRKRRTAS